MSRVLPVAFATAATLLASMFWQLHSFAEPRLAELPKHLAVPALVRDAPEIDANEVAQGWVATAVERPLFREDRRPLKAASDVVLEADEPLRLTGVIIGPFGKRAIFMSEKNAKPIVMVEGARVGNLMVRLIEPGRAVVELGGDVRTLKPTFAKESPALQR
jgi:hypothetical protein